MPLRLILLILLILLTATTVTAQPAQNSPRQYPDSPEGFRLQLEDLISASKSGDEALLAADLDALALPNPTDWIAAHFSSGDLPKLQQDYPFSFAGFRKHIASFAVTVNQTSGFEIAVQPSELPTPPHDDAEEQALPAPRYSVSVQNFRYGSTNPDDRTPSHVNSFVYLDGRFRYVGGTYPFWWEDLQRIRRGSSALAQGRDPIVMHAARLINKVSPEYPKKARKHHIEGTVRLHAIISKDGAPRKLDVISGDPLLADAALKAVRQWRYLPTLLNGQPVEVDTTIDVIFALNRKD